MLDKKSANKSGRYLDLNKIWFYICIMF